MPPCYQKPVRVVNKQDRSHNKKCVCVCVAHDYLQDRVLQGWLDCRRTKPQEEEIYWMGSLMIGAAQQTVWLSHDWWDTKHAMEKWIIHTKFVVGNLEWKSHLGRSRRGWRIKERQYENLDLRVTIFIVFRSENYMFLHCYFKSHCTECTDHQILVSLKYLQNLSYLYEVTSISCLSCGMLLLLYVVNVVMLLNMHRG
jgi:hypothetical protein